MLARDVLIASRGCLAVLDKPLGQVAVTYLVKYVERIDQQAFVLGRRIGDGVNVGRVFGPVPAFETQCCVDANAAWIER